MVAVDGEKRGRGRPAGSTNKKPNLSVVGGGAPADAKIGHNSALNDEEQQALHLNVHVPDYEKALKAKNDADANFKNVCKRIKSEGGNVSEVKRTIQLRSPEGEKTVKAELESLMKVARWAGLPVGTQVDMFEETRSQFERGQEEGKRAGMAGDPCKPDFAPGTDGHRGYMEGYQHGQMILIKIKPTPKAADEGAQLLRTDENQPLKTDEFDAASDKTANTSSGSSTEEPTTDQVSEEENPAE